MARNRPLSSREVSQAKALLEARFVLADEEQDENAGDILLRTNVDMHQAAKIMEHKYAVVLFYDQSSLFAIEVTRQDHGFATDMIARILVDQLPQRSMLCCASSVDLQVSPTRRRQPDKELIPMPRLGNFPHRDQPTLVVEVAVTQSLQSSYRTATDYLGAGSLSVGVQIVLCVKLYKPTTINNVAHRRMLFLMFTRNPAMVVVGGLVVPQVVVSFGNLPIVAATLGALGTLGVPAGMVRGYHSQSNDLPCSQRNMGPYLINLPSNLVLHGASYPIPAGLQNGFHLDLFEVQEQGLLFTN